jgi:ribosome-binding factor A
MHDRITQLNDLIRDILGEIIVREVSFKQGIICTVTRVETARSLRSTHVFLSILPVEDRTYVFKTIKHEHHRIEWLFHKKLATRPLPKLFFKLDTTAEKADEIERLVQSIHNEHGE